MAGAARAKGEAAEAAEVEKEAADAAEVDKGAAETAENGENATKVVEIKEEAGLAPRDNGATGGVVKRAPGSEATAIGAAGRVAKVAGGKRLAIEANGGAD